MTDIETAQTTIAELVAQLRDWAERAGSEVSSFADFVTLVEEIKDGMDGHADDLEEIGTWLEDDAHREAAESIADDLEGQFAPTPDSDDADDNTFEAGLAAAATYLRENY